MEREANLRRKATPVRMILTKEKVVNLLQALPRAVLRSVEARRMRVESRQETIRRRPMGTRKGKTSRRTSAFFSSTASAPKGRIAFMVI
eukprot:3389705-Amphidinium_carterae.2